MLIVVRVSGGARQLYFDVSAAPGRLIDDIVTDVIQAWKERHPEVPVDHYIRGKLAQYVGRNFHNLSGGKWDQVQPLEYVPDLTAVPDARARTAEQRPPPRRVPQASDGPGRHAGPVQDATESPAGHSQPIAPKVYDD
jgi:hypothetical protein